MAVFPATAFSVTAAGEARTRHFALATYTAYTAHALYAFQRTSNCSLLVMGIWSAAA